MNNSPSNIFQPLLLVERYDQSSQAVLAATGMNGLTLMLLVANLAKKSFHPCALDESSLSIGRIDK